MVELKFDKFACNCFLSRRTTYHFEDRNIFCERNKELALSLSHSLDEIPLACVTIIKGFRLHSREKWMQMLR